MARTRRAGSFWTPERIEEACIMWNVYGLTTKAIGERLGATKNSVSSIASRYRELFPQRYKSAIKPRGKASRPVKARVAHDKPEPATNNPTPKDDGYPWPITGGCRYILNDDTRHPHWCGAERVGFTAWCREHFHVVYQPAKREAA